MKRSKISGQIATTKLETPSLSIFIENNNGIHVHVRNGERFQGKQAECPLCANGSQFEQAMGRIGA